ncbi:archaeosine biosynthesis radical SAM protein RaSEA [Thermoplasma sp.]|uniref:archaeosine biosynthesis radical SAM protein RaSEA n=1 Tax=Thermoplasma sp. TaxID=1973142 RepID=UPI00128268EB|nr:archaeosine biosynthesis radical SAM protein RaSEA [Thermoplasma sp.]KAA8923394.1 MAG: TIGR01210 family radical SAM protein [Thermoplasma sp.]
MVNKDLALFVRSLMPDTKGKGDPDRPVSMWNELDRLRGFPEKTTVVIFRTRGCSWYKFSSCSMCGYFNDTQDVTEENLYHQIDHVAATLNSEVVKVFTSGSFLDPMEIPDQVRLYFYDRIGSKISKLLVESRTEYIRPERMEELKKIGIPVRIAIGLESANDYLIENSINKGSTFRKYVDAANTARKYGMEVRTYLLFKPPFISEKAAMTDIIDSIRKIRDLTTDVSINPMNIQKNTLVEYLWKNGLYRPPRLYSLAKVLMDGIKIGPEVISYPTGGNKERGVHNDVFDDRLLDLIVKSSLNQDITELELYMESLDLSSFWNMIEEEDRAMVQVDFERMIRQALSAVPEI